MDSSVSLKDQIWFLRVCHHVSNVLYLGSFLPVKRPRREADGSLPSRAEVQNGWSSTPNLLHSIMSWAGKTSRFTFNINIIQQHTLQFRKWSLPYSCHVQVPLPYSCHVPVPLPYSCHVPVQHTNRPLHALPTTIHNEKLKLQNLRHCKRTLQLSCECQNSNSTHEKQGVMYLLQRRTKPITPAARRQNGSGAHAVVYALTIRT